MKNGTFHTSENTLDDGSKTYDVYFSSSYGQELIAEPPSLAAAEFFSRSTQRDPHRDTQLRIRPRSRKNRPFSSLTFRKVRP